MNDWQFVCRVRPATKAILEWYENDGDDSMSTECWGDTPDGVPQDLWEVVRPLML